MQITYFVISLPRSGTSSLSRMAKICGLRQNHAPHSTIFNKLGRNEFDFYSDTPIYVPSVVEKLCNLETVKPKFIYIDRDFDNIYNSWKQVGLLKDYNMMYNRYYVVKDNLGSHHSMIFDIQSYHEAFGETHLNDDNYKEIFENHKNKVLNMVKNEDLLIYNFDMGWKPFCDFLNCEVPQDELPHVNKNKMFDKI